MYFTYACYIVTGVNVWVAMVKLRYQICSVAAKMVNRMNNRVDEKHAVCSCAASRTGGWSGPGH